MRSDTIARLKGIDLWQQDPASPLYDHELIKTRLKHLYHISTSGDLSTIVFFLRAGLIRSLGGCNNPRLFAKSLTGSKSLIHEYNRQIVSLLELVEGQEFPESNPHVIYEFISDTLRCFGRTALILDGGAGLG